MLATVLLLPLLAASSVLASVKDDLGNAFKGLGLTVWDDALDVLSDALIDELVTLLTGNSGRTFFVPDGDALSAEELASLITHASTFLDTVEYHIVNQEVDATTIASSPNHTVAYTTLTSNSTVFLENDAAQVLVLTKQSDNNIHILNQPNDVTSSGSVTVDINGTSVTFSTINAVLTPPGDFKTTAAAHNVTQFIQDVVSAGIEDTFENQHGITLFVPSDDAFAAANGSLAALSTGDLANTINNHVLNGTVYSSGFNGNKETSSGHNLTLSATSISFSGGSSAKIVTSDIPLQNGVMHIIDTVLTDTESSSSGGVKEVVVHGSMAALIAMGAVYLVI